MEDETQRVRRGEVEEPNRLPLDEADDFESLVAYPAEVHEIVLGRRVGE